MGDENTMNNLFEILIYFLMTPRVEACPMEYQKMFTRTLLQSFTEQFEKVLQSNSKNYSDFIMNVFMATRKSKGERKYLYWKFIAVMLETDQYNEDDHNTLLFKNVLVRYQKAIGESSIVHILGRDPRDLHSY